MRLAGIFAYSVIIATTNAWAQNKLSSLPVTIGGAPKSAACFGTGEVMGLDPKGIASCPCGVGRGVLSLRKSIGCTPDRKSTSARWRECGWALFMITQGKTWTAGSTRPRDLGASTTGHVGRVGSTKGTWAMSADLMNAGRRAKGRLIERN